MQARDDWMDFYLGWFANPIFKNGKYPDVMREKVQKHELFPTTYPGLQSYYK